MGNPPTLRHSCSPPPSWPWPWPTPAATAPPSSPPSKLGSCQKRALQHKGLSWLVESAQAQRTWPHARQAFLDSGIKLQLFYGLATGTPLRIGCALTAAQPLRTLA